MESKVKNIILIGMMGCGKTTIGKMISSRLNKKFIDLDEYIENKQGCTIPEIFKNGEDYFRKLECKAVDTISNEENVIISTGGGVIKNEENIINLKKNGIIFFIDRPLENIVMDVDIMSRPLLKNGTCEIEKIFKERYNLYKNYCDFLVDNVGEILKIVDNIISIYNKSMELNIKKDEC